MSRADAARRILEAAIGLGTASGASALSMQGVAGAAGVSKALVLYHYQSKAALLTALLTALGERSASRLHAAARSDAPQAAWRALVSAECSSRELALLAALSLEPNVAPAQVEAAQEDRAAGATALVVRLLATFGLEPRIPAPFAGRLLLRELDALVVAAARIAPAADALAAEQDVMLLALLALGR